MNKLDKDWEEVSSPESGYSVYRKILKDENGNPIKGIWKAENESTGEIFNITYDQARGYEPIDNSPIKQLSRKLGEILLPN